MGLKAQDFGHRADAGDHVASGRIRQRRVGFSELDQGIKRGFGGGLEHGISCHSRTFLPNR